MTSSMWLWCHCHESYIFLRSKTESSSVEFAPHLSKWTNQNSGQHMTSLLRDHHCRPISVLYGSNKVTIVQIFSFVTSITITSQWRHKKPKFDSRAVNIFNWLWITSFYQLFNPVCYLFLYHDHLVTWMSTLCRHQWSKMLWRWWSPMALLRRFQ